MPPDDVADVCVRGPMKRYGETMLGPWGSGKTTTLPLTAPVYSAPRLAGSSGLALERPRTGAAAVRP